MAANMTWRQEVERPRSAALDQILVSICIAPVLLLVVSIVVKLRGMEPKASKLKLPPSPKGVPILGNMLEIRGPQKHRLLAGLAEKLGSLFALKTGVKDFIVITSADIAHEALILNSQVFSSRPKLLSRLNYTGWRSVSSALYGPYWRGVRKNLVAQVLSTSRVAAFQPFREMELNNLIERMRDQAKNNDNVVPVLSNCRFTVFSILLHVCFGKGFEPSAIQDVDVILRRLLIILAPQAIDFLPFLQIFSKKHRNECQELLGRMRKLFGPLIEEHRELRKNGAPTGDYVDSLIVLEKEMNLVETDILGLIAEVLAGGTDTTANTVEWAMANLVHYPDIQARLYEEIKSVVPGDELVGEEHVDKMPYLHAVVKETLRKHPPSPFAITYGVTERTKLRGYDIPADAMVSFNVLAMHNNPERWDQPWKFNPERFVSSTPNPDHDMTGSHGPRSCDFIPFGAGRRICPGIRLGLTHVHLILARLVQTFEWSTVNLGEGVDFSEKLESTIVMTNPLHARISERRPCK